MTEITILHERDNSPLFSVAYEKRIHFSQRIRAKTNTWHHCHVYYCKRPTTTTDGKRAVVNAVYYQ